MPKLKSKKGVRKRIRISKQGKVQFKPSGKGHLLTTKSRKRKRRLRTGVTLEGAMAKKLRKLV